MFTKLKSKKSQSGVTMIEYALLASLIAIALVALFPEIREAILTIFTRIRDALTGAAA
jgi:Flp pilus assembly pilin Flp